MPMPGFEAESSLLELGSYKSHARSGNFWEPSPWEIGPASIFARPCIPGCICVTGEGCPCCSSILDIFKGISRK